MRLTNRLYDPFSQEHLALLAQIAIEAQVAYFGRNPHTVPFYRDRLIGAALCQGAALHYIGQGDGVRDVDIHYFFEQHAEKPRLSRAVYSIQRPLPAFGVRDIDFVRTLIPERIVRGRRSEPVSVIRDFLRQRPTANARYLAGKAVILLLPKPLLGTLVWPTQPDQ